jgi:hypothetical protein
MKHKFKVGDKVRARLTLAKSEAGEVVASFYYPRNIGFSNERIYVVRTEKPYELDEEYLYCRILREAVLEKI